MNLANWVEILRARIFSYNHSNHTTPIYMTKARTSMVTADIRNENLTEDCDAKYIKILVVQTGFIGDVVLSTPVIQNIKELYSRVGEENRAVELHLMTTPKGAELLGWDGELDHIVIFDKRGADSGWKGLFKMARILRKEKYDVVFSLHKSWRTALLLYLSKIKIRYGFEEAAGQFLYTGTAPRSDLSHEVLRNMSILRNVLLDYTPCSEKRGHDTPCCQIGDGQLQNELRYKLSISLSPQSIEFAERMTFSSSPKRLVGICPGSVWETKRWSEEGFASVVETLLERGFRVVVLGGKDEVLFGSSLVKALGQRFGHEDLIDLTGKTSLIELASVIASLDVLVSNDSSPLHLAAAFGVPTVALFCSTIPEFGFGPWMVSNICLGVPSLSCRPCGVHGHRKCPTGTSACMTGIEPAFVTEAVSKLLSGSNSAGRPES